MSTTKETGTRKASAPPSRPAAPARAPQATTARKTEGADKPAPKKDEPARTGDKVTRGPQEEPPTKNEKRTQQLENFRKNYGAFYAAGDDDGDKDNKVTQKDVDEIQDLKKEGKLDDYLRDQYGDKNLDQRVKQTEEAADYLDKPENLANLDTANGGEADGEISVSDADKRLTESRDKLPAEDQRKLARENRENARTFNKNFDRFDGAADGGKTDGNVSREDIQAIADGRNGASKEAREAARYYLDNPDRLRGLDNAAAEDKSGEGDDRITRDDVDDTLIAANRDVRNKGRNVEQIERYDARVARRQRDGINEVQKNYDTLAGEDGKISREELENTANDRTANAETRRSAQYLLDNPGRLRALDTAAAQGGDTDGVISRDDVKAARIDAFNEVRKNPDAQRRNFVEKQQKQDWKSPADALQNLKENPDLSSYSDAQLQSLNLLAAKNPKYRDEIAAATGNYVNERTNSLDDIPESQQFQGLLSTQVVENPNFDSLAKGTQDVVQSAQDNLRGQVDRSLSSSLDRNLEGKEGDDEAEQGLEGFGTDLQGLARKNPALVPFFKTGAETLLQDEKTAEKINDVKQADDGLLGDVTNWVGGAIKDSTAWVGDKLGDVAKLGFKYGPLGLPATLATEGLALAGVDAPKKVWDDIATGAIDRPIESLVGGVGGTLGGAVENPVDFGKGLYNLSGVKSWVDLARGKNPLDVIKERGETLKGVGEAFISDYKQTFEEDGAVAGVSHIGSDIVTTIATGGLGKVPTAISGTGKIARGLNQTLDVARAGWKGYDGVTGTAGDVVKNAFGDGSKLPVWAQDLASGAAGNLQGSLIQELGKDESAFNYDLNNQVQEAMARLQQWFQGQAAWPATGR